MSFIRYWCFLSSRRRHTRCREVSWARRCVSETGSEVRIIAYGFIVSRNSSLSCVCIIRSWIVFIASIGFMSAMNLRSTHMRSSVSLSCSKSSRRVLEATRLTAGNILLLLKLRSSWSSMLPVPLNSSNITSSFLLSVSIRAVATIAS